MHGFLVSNGVVFCEGGFLRPFILGCLAECEAVFPELFGRVDFWYLYNQNRQKSESLRQNDAIFWYHKTKNGTMTFAIGISNDAAEQGEEYLLLCILHELAHLSEYLVDGKTGHSAKFHTRLNRMIEIFNKKTEKTSKTIFSGCKCVSTVRSIAFVEKTSPL